MPIYEYRCKNGHTLEVMQRMSDDALATCTTCQAPVKRVFHPIAVHFKGSGFYNTDYGKKSKAADDAKSRDEGESKAGSDSSSKDSASNDSSSKDSSSKESSSKSSSTSSDSGGSKSDSKAKSGSKSSG